MDTLFDVHTLIIVSLNEDSIYCRNPLMYYIFVSWKVGLSTFSSFANRNEFLTHITHFKMNRIHDDSVYGTMIVSSESPQDWNLTPLYPTPLLGLVTSSLTTCISLAMFYINVEAM
jgi:hypothetical protein